MGLGQPGSRQKGPQMGSFPWPSHTFPVDLAEQSRFRRPFHSRRHRFPKPTNPSENLAEELAGHSYVRDSDGPWLLYDNQDDPYQMNNLIDDPAHTDLQAALEAELKSQLDRIGDEFPSRDEAIAQWGYLVNAGGEIPYTGEFRAQSPGSEPGEVCQF